MKLIRLGLLINTLMLFMVSCKHNPEIAITPEMSFSNDVKPIINSNCAQSGCHGATNYEEFQLLTYDQVLSKSKTGNEATSAILYKAIIGKGAEDMPPSPNTPLNELQIKRILLWMQQGAKNN